MRNEMHTLITRSGFDAEVGTVVPQLRGFMGYALVKCHHIFREEYSGLRSVRLRYPVLLHFNMYRIFFPRPSSLTPCPSLRR